MYSQNALLIDLPYLIQTKLIIVICVTHSMLIKRCLEHVAIGIFAIAFFVYLIAILVTIIDAHWKCSLRLWLPLPVNHMWLHG